MNLAKEKRAIQYLKSFEPEAEPYYLCYSGGKDSDVIRILAQLAGVRHELHHNLTTVDAPETVRYVKSIPEMQVHYPELSMWQLIVKKGMPPTRLVRYCCSELKEKGGKGRLKITGVRWAESNNRRENSDVVKIIGKPKTVQSLGNNLNASFQSSQKGRKKEFARYPKYKTMYIKAFDKMLEVRKALGKPTCDMWQSGEDVYKWWVGDDPSQLTMFDDEEGW